jgi:Fe-S-cluster containining protein
MTDSGPYDCLACGRCCFAGENYVQVYEEDLVTLGPRNVSTYVVGSTLPADRLRAGENGSERYMRMSDGHCAALDPTPGRWACRIYEDRPLLCRVYEPGSPACLAARARPTQALT